MEGKLGGFTNDSKYGDDDLTVGHQSLPVVSYLQ
jgi:L-rhamnose isomerase